MEPTQPKQNTEFDIYGALGVAGQVGCIGLILAIGALLVGLWLDQTFGGRRIFVVVCVIASVPINLYITLRITRRLIARVIPQTKSGTGFTPTKAPKADPADDQP